MVDKDDSAMPLAIGAGLGILAMVALKCRQSNYMGLGQRIHSMQSDSGALCENLQLATSAICGTSCPPCPCPENPEAGYNFYGQTLVRRPRRYY